MQAIKFTNYSNEAFTGYWDSQAYEFAPGDSMTLEDWKARHFAKHLANRELIKAGLENYTSPKNPQDSPQFMQFFNKAFTSPAGEDKPASVVESEVINANAEEGFEEEPEEEVKPKAKKVVKKSPKKAVEPVVEEEFEGLEE